MPRKPDTLEERNQKLAQSFTIELKRFEKAFASPLGVWFEFRSTGEAVNAVQRLNKCRVFLRKTALMSRGVETFDNVVIRREDTKVIMQKSEPIREGHMAFQEPTPNPRKDWGPEPAALVVPSDEEVLRRLTEMEEMIKHLPRNNKLTPEFINKQLLEDFGNDEFLLQETLGRLVARKLMKWNETGEMTTRMEGG